MGDQVWSTRWNDLVIRQGYRLDDYIAYSSNDQNQHAAIYVKDGTPFQFLQYADQDKFMEKSRIFASSGYYPISVNATPSRGGDMFNGIWIKRPGKRSFVYVNMTSDEYQTKFNYFVSKNYRVAKMRNYRKLWI